LTVRSQHYGAGKVVDLDEELAEKVIPTQHGNTYGTEVCR